MERIRDKISGAKERGKHCGGMPILGYDTVEKGHVVSQKEAKLVRKIFRRFVDLGSATALMAELNAQGHRTKAWTTVREIVRDGGSCSKPHIYALLNNPKYQGLVEHRGKTYPDVDRSYVRRILRLASLAPDIVEAILRGTEPSGLSLERLAKALPVLWEEQRKALGFAYA